MPRVWSEPGTTTLELPGSRVQQSIVRSRAARRATCVCTWARTAVSLRRWTWSVDGMLTQVWVTFNRLHRLTRSASPKAVVPSSGRGAALSDDEGRSSDNEREYETRCWAHWLALPERSRLDEERCEFDVPQIRRSRSMMRNAVAGFSFASVVDVDKVTVTLRGKCLRTSLSPSF